jgi:hypothetical protein
MAHKIDLLKRNFFNHAIADIYRALDGKSMIGAFILTFCLIDCLNWIEFGNQKRGFNKWIVKRLLPQNLYYNNKEEELYSVRCGLVHCYGPSNQIINQEFLGYHLMECNPGLHLMRVNDDHLKICLYSILTETVFAAHLIFEELKQAVSLEQLDRLNRQINSNHGIVPDVYKDMHIALDVFDKYPKLELNHVKAGYTKHILYAQRHL